MSGERPRREGYLSELERVMLLDERAELQRQLDATSRESDTRRFAGMGGLELARERIAIRERIREIDNELDLA